MVFGLEVDLLLTIDVILSILHFFIKLFGYVGDLCTIYLLKLLNYIIKFFPSAVKYEIQFLFYFFRLYNYILKYEQSC